MESRFVRGKGFRVTAGEAANLRNPGVFLLLCFVDEVRLRLLNDLGLLMATQVMSSARLSFLLMRKDAGKLGCGIKSRQMA